MNVLGGLGRRTLQLVFVLVIAIILVIIIITVIVIMQFFSWSRWYTRILSPIRPPHVTWMDVREWEFNSFSLNHLSLSSSAAFRPVCCSPELFQLFFQCPRRILSADSWYYVCFCYFHVQSLQKLVLQISTMLTCSFSFLPTLASKGHTSLIVKQVLPFLPSRTKSDFCWPILFLFE